MRNEVEGKSWFRNRILGRRPGIKSVSGQAQVELAVLLPVAIALLVGITEIGRYANTCIVVSHAANAGVQYAAQNRVTASSDALIIQAAKADAPNIAHLTVTPGHYCTCANGSSSTCQPTDCSNSRIIEYVKVNTQTQMNSVFSYPGFPRSFTVKGEKIMRVSQ
ncbi:MAG TPA: TadE family protein [Terriglobia bacterium]|nr:TadE family protein [Terriglobia bacterium]